MAENITAAAPEPEETPQPEHHEVIHVPPQTVGEATNISNLKWEPVATKEISAWSQIVTERLVVTPTLQLFRDIIMTKEHHVWKVDRVLHIVVRGT